MKYSAATLVLAEHVKIMLIFLLPLPSLQHWCWIGDQHLITAVRIHSFIWDLCSLKIKKNIKWNWFVAQTFFFCINYTLARFEAQYTHFPIWHCFIYAQLCSVILITPCRDSWQCVIKHSIYIGCRFDACWCFNQLIVASKCWLLWQMWNYNL